MRLERRAITGAMAALMAFSPVLLMSTSSSAQQAIQTPARSSHVAKGSFSVQMKPLSESGFGEGNANLGRLSLDKTFEGDLVATGKGEMLTAMTQTKGSAGYVAIERVTGTLQGRKGSFVLQHTGLMDRGTPSLRIDVVPDSGSGDLVGLAGQLAIRIEGGKHFYEFEYSLPDLLK
jgi:hypothetical protein